MKRMYHDDNDSVHGGKLIFLLVIVLAACVLLVYLSYMYFTAKALGEEVLTSWFRLEQTLEAKAEAVTLLAGYLVRRREVSSDTLDRSIKDWEDLISTDEPLEKLNAGQRINSGSYGLIAMAKAGGGAGRNERVQRVLEDVDSLELRLASDIERYNMSVIKLRSIRDGHYFGELLMAFSGGGDFDTFGLRPRSTD